MPAHLPPTIDPVAARRWAGWPLAESPWLHDEVSRRMAERLAWIRLPVRRWAHWEPVRGGREARALVAARYPGSECFEVFAGANQAPEATENVAKKWWQRLGLGGGSAPTLGTAPPDGAMQLVWANMLAHQAADPGALLAGWHRALAVDGFVMFSCFGPDTLRELRAAHADAGWPPPAQDFTDMHDWGDQLVAAGFAEPVMDMEHITLTFETPARLLAELRGLGRNLHPARFAGLRTPAWRGRLEAALERHLRPAGGGPLALTFEIIYGHALKPAPRHAVAPRAEISVDEMRASLRQRRKAPPA